MGAVSTSLSTLVPVDRRRFASVYFDKGTQETGVDEKSLMSTGVSVVPRNYSYLNPMYRESLVLPDQSHPSPPVPTESKPFALDV